MYVRRMTCTSCGPGLGDSPRDRDSMRRSLVSRPINLGANPPKIGRRCRRATRPPTVSLTTGASRPRPSCLGSRSRSALARRSLGARRAWSEGRGAVRSSSLVVEGEGARSPTWRSGEDFWIPFTSHILCCVSLLHDAGRQGPGARRGGCDQGVGAATQLRHLGRGIVPRRPARLCWVYADQWGGTERQAPEAVGGRRRRRSADAAHEAQQRRVGPRRAGVVDLGAGRGRVAAQGAAPVEADPASCVDDPLDQVDEPGAGRGDEGEWGSRSCRRGRRPRG